MYTLKCNHLNSNIECSFAITPTGEPEQFRLTVNIVRGTPRIQTFNGTNKGTNATVITRSTQTQVNCGKPVCGISSLEVYRGREQVIKINHTGFVLSNSGTIEVMNNH